MFSSDMQKGRLILGSLEIENRMFRVKRNDRREMLNKSAVTCKIMKRLELYRAAVTLYIAPFP